MKATKSITRKRKYHKKPRAILVTSAHGITADTVIYGEIEVEIEVEGEPSK